MTKINWLQLAKERIQAVLHNRPDNNYLQNAIKFINEAIALIKIDDKYEEEFEDGYTCNYDELLNEELGLILDNHNLTKLMYDYFKGTKIKIKAKEGKIVIEKIK